MSQSVRRLALMLLGPLLISGAVVLYFVANVHAAATDNAYIQQDKVSVSAEVGGTIVEVAIRENQRVSAGDLLFRIDPEPYELAVAEAKAALASATARLEELEIRYATADIEIESAREEEAYYEREYQRQLNLGKTKVTSESTLQAAEHALSQARSRLAAARADKEKAKAALSTGGSASGINPEIEAARVRLEKAQLNLSRTAIRSPVTGIASQMERLQVGQLMVQGLPAVSIVKSDVSWVEANFKETDLAGIRVGQPATIKLDTYDDMEIFGTVESIGAGTGSEFSILPAQNATGNWVKVTQRVPVRIAINEMPSQPLIAGLSAHVRIDISKR